MSLLRAIILFAVMPPILSGCQTSTGGRGAFTRASPPATTRLTQVRPAPLASDYFAGSAAAIPAQPTAAIAPANHQENLPLPPVASDESPAEVIAGQVLSREQFVADVLARNPSLAAMIAAWQAAAQRYPQAVALDDPMFMGMLAPASMNSSTVEGAYVLQMGQKLPWFGKRALRGEVAASEADAAYQDAADARLQLALVADLAFFDYYLTERQTALIEQNTRLMREYRETAQSKYRTGQVTQQDVLQADVELAEFERRQIELARMRKVAAARINTLLRRWPDAPLPPPPPALELPQQPADANLLWQSALQQRPDLAAIGEQIRAQEAALALAYKQYYPDFDVFGRYDTFWQPASTQGDLRGSVGMNLNVPIYRQKLKAAVCEAQFRLNQRRAEYEQKVADVQYEVLAAHEQVQESLQTVRLYAERLIPAAEQNVAAARANYEVGKLNFLDLSQAQRQLVTMRERELEAQAEYHRRFSNLSRASGSPGSILTD